MDEDRIEESYGLERFIKQPHIEMLAQRGEAQAVEELINREVTTLKPTSKLIACLKRITN